MMMWDGNLDIDEIVSRDGVRQSVPYVDWKVGDAEIYLDGHFTIADLRWLADFMSGLRGDALEPAGD